MRHCALGEIEQIVELTHADSASMVVEHIDDLQPDRIAQRTSNGCKSLGVLELDLWPYERLAGEILA